MGIFGAIVAGIGGAIVKATADSIGKSVQSESSGSSNSSNESSSSNNTNTTVAQKVVKKIKAATKKFSDTISSVSYNLTGHNSYYGANIKTTDGYTSKDGTKFNFKGHYTEDNIQVPAGAVYDASQDKWIWKTQEGTIFVKYSNGTARSIDDGESQYQHAQAALAAIQKSTKPTTILPQQSLSQGALDLAPDKGIVYVYDEYGNKTKTYDHIALVDGAFYNEQGEILNSAYTGNGVYNTQTEYTYTWSRNAQGIMVGVFKKIPKPTPEPINIPTREVEYYEGDPIPDIPPFIYFDVPIPTFYADLNKINKYTYFLGIDELTIKNNTNNNTSCFISKNITLNKVKAIQLEANYFCDDNSSIEFYIVDGTNEIPILPINETIVQNEKIFLNLPTRFQIDETKDILIKEKNNITKYTLSDYKNNLLDMSKEYNISYSPITNYFYKPYNNTIKIKVIIRNYVLNEMLPFIKDLKIRMYGEDNLWNMNI